LVARCNAGHFFSVLSLGGFCLHYVSPAFNDVGANPAPSHLRGDPPPLAGPGKRVNDEFVRLSYSGNSFCRGSAHRLDFKALWAVELSVPIAVEAWVGKRYRK
jgi:hypothetical protein